MPLVKIEDIAEKATVGAWEATESDAFFLSALTEGFLTGYEGNRFSEQRRREFLASRFLLKKVIRDDSVRLELASNGKLKTCNDRYHLSVSHSNQMAAAITSSKFPVGIDIEAVHPRVLRVMRKFLSATELKALGDNPEIWKVTLCWSAKESIYKMLGQPGLSFSQAITLNLPADNRSSFVAAVNNSPVKIYFERTGNYIMTYCIGS